MSARMYTLARRTALVAVLVCSLGGQADPPFADRAPSPVLDAGFDERIRQEAVHNQPGLPGNRHTYNTAVRCADQNYIRWRTRVWASADWESWRLYTRVGNEFRTYGLKNGKPYHQCKYAFPDQVYLDSLYLQGKGLFDGALDLRLGRMDMMKGYDSVLGLDHILTDNTPGDGSRTAFMNVGWASWHLDEDTTLDGFVTYNDGQNDASFGTALAQQRNLSVMVPTDTGCGEDWGGGLVFHGKAAADFPFRLYSVFRHNDDYNNKGDKMPGKDLAAFGFRVMPKLTDTLTFDFEAADQQGRTRAGHAAGGWMFDAALRYRDRHEGIKPYSTLDLVFLSGDRRHSDREDSDRAWDPMWGRSTRYSTIFCYGTHERHYYWSNLVYPNLMLGLDLGRRHSIELTTGPMFVAADDGLGGGDGRFRGEHSKARYVFPISIPAKDGRLELWGRVQYEVFNPGGYHASDRPAHYVCWEFDMKF